jgi:hypothetical protein
LLPRFNFTSLCAVSKYHLLTPVERNDLFEVLFPSSGRTSRVVIPALLDEFCHQERLIPAASPVAGQLIQIFPPGAWDR